ncbi:MAG TPA: hypothetical protein VMV44_09995 [Rectinemataceae bacterium]|nr:hypothetical protein [Rectinemataceae bacterium]
MSLPSRLLVLDLGRDLAFPEAFDAPVGVGGFFPVGPRAEGGEEVHLYPADIFSSGPEGPRCQRPLPKPDASWRSGTESPGGREAASEAGLLIGAGSWLFAQWRPLDGKELELGVEWFAREAWWERRPLVGDLFLRIVREDDRLAFQLLRRLDEAGARLPGDEGPANRGA